MIFQRQLQGKFFTAYVAFVRRLPGVSGHVLGEADDGQQRFTADVTVVSFLVTLEMILQRLRRLRMFSAHSANTLRIAHVTPGVFDQHDVGLVQIPARSAGQKVGAALRLGREFHSIRLHAAKSGSSLCRRL